MSASNSPRRRHREKRTDTTVVCTSTGKIRHGRRKLALTALNSQRAMILRARARGVDNDPSRELPVEVYRCVECAGWHVTSHPTRDPQSANLRARLAIEDYAEERFS